MVRLKTNPLTSREQFYQIFRDTKWMIAISLLLSVLLFLPDQIRELYRIVVADITFSNFNINDAIKVAIIAVKFILPLIALSFVLWFGTYVITTQSVASISGPSSTTRFIAKIIPPLFGVLPLLACAAGQLLSLPSLANYDDSNEVVAGVWDNFGPKLADTVGLGLKITALATLLLAVWIFSIAWKRDDRWQTISLRASTHYFSDGRLLILTVVVIAVFAAFFLFAPVAFARTLGTFGILAVYALCAVSFCVHLTLLTIKHRFPYIPALFAFALLIAWADFNDNHEVRPLTAESRPEAAESAGKQFEKWYESRLDLAAYDEYPVYVVSAQGGGIYAAYQTAIFLARMQDYCPAFNDHLFAISSVSGGSLGASAFAAVMQARAGDRAATPIASSPDVGASIDPCPVITEFLRAEGRMPKGFGGERATEIALRKIFANDFLSPLIGAMFFLDFSQGFIPYPIPAFDRARALEYAFESAELSQGPGTKQFLDKNYAAHWNPDGRVPALLINTTDAGSGRRVVISPFALEDDNGQATDASIVRYQELGENRDQSGNKAPGALRLSTAAGISARFSWVTPAATVRIKDDRFGPKEKLRLVDGGYFENSGIETAISLVGAIDGTVKRINQNAGDPSKTFGPNATKYRKVKPKLIVLSGGDYPLRQSFAFGEIMEPVRTLLSTRESRAYVAIDRAARKFEPEFVGEAKSGSREVIVRASDLRRVSLSSRFYPLPLGWAMSDGTRRIIENQSGNFWACEPSTNFTQSEKSLSETDCIQLLIYHELNRSVTAAAAEIGVSALVAPGSASKKPAERLPRNEMVDCYRTKAVPDMLRRQAQSLEALLKIWDARADLTGDHLLAFILATIANETGNFNNRVEDLSFASAERIQALWPNRFPTVADAAPFVNKPEELAEKVYGGRFDNTQPGDGWRYRGRGMALLLGREEYGKYGGLLGINLLDNPDWVLNPLVGAHIAFMSYFGSTAISTIEPFLNRDKPDWAGAAAMVPRLVDREGIPRKSEILLACINETKRKPK